MEYKGSCHCGAFKFKVNLELTELEDCNCSICSRKATITKSVLEEELKILSGAEHLMDYQFGNKYWNHPFCKFCGITPYISSKDKHGIMHYGINIRTLEGVTISELKNIEHYDGLHLL